MIAWVDLEGKDVTDIGSSMLEAHSVHIEIDSVCISFKFPQGFVWKILWDEVVDTQQALDTANQHMSKIIREAGGIKPGFMGGGSMGARDEGDDLPGSKGRS